MKTLHTPGPWFAVNYSGYIGLQSQDFYSDDDDLLNEEKCTEAEANGRLAAAAPELLYAVIDLPKHLIDVADILRSHARRNGAASVYDKVLEEVAYKIQAAIAKAIGEKEVQS